MADPTTAREALLAELIGEVAELLRRLDMLVHLVNEARRDLADTASELTARAQSFKAEADTLAGALKLRLVEHVAQRTEELAQQSLRTHTEAMAHAARAALRAELTPVLGQLASRLQESTGDSSRRRLATWSAHLLTAAVSASSAVLLMAALLPR